MLETITVPSVYCILPRTCRRPPPVYRILRGELHSFVLAACRSPSCAGIPSQSQNFTSSCLTFFRSLFPPFAQRCSRWWAGGWRIDTEASKRSWPGWRLGACVRSSPRLRQLRVRQPSLQQGTETSSALYACRQLAYCRVPCDRRRTM